MRITAFERYLIEDIKSIWSKMVKGDAITPFILSDMLNIYNVKARDMLDYCYKNDLLANCVFFKKPRNYNPKNYNYSIVYIKW